jgi:hypothetical protein
LTPCWPQVRQVTLTRFTAPDAPVLPCAGPAPLPSEPPAIGWRAGIDLDPLDSTNNDDVAWLQALI